MATKTLRGSYTNRLMEDHDFVDTIEVGTKMTEFMYTDRAVYEVVKVVDQKHVYVRRMKAIAVGEPMTNTWELESDEKAEVSYITKRGKYWYWTVSVTREEYMKNKDEMYFRLFMVHNLFNPQEFETKEKLTRYHRANVSFGIADYYFDYSF